MFRKHNKALGKTGIDVQQAPQEPYPNHQKAPCLPTMLRDRQDNTIGKQSFRILLPSNLSDVKEEERRILQRWLDLVDWRESKVRSQAARQHSGMWVYVGMQPNGTGKSVDSSSRYMRCNAEGERDVKRSRDRYETLRTIVRQGDHAAEGSNAIRQALEELGGSQDPAQMVLGAAAAL